MSTHRCSLEQLAPWIQELSKQFSKKQLVRLNGDLGAGKTEFVKTVLQNMGSQEVASPTYGLIHEYQTSERKNIFHIDLYRINDEEDLESSGFWDLFSMTEGLIFVEWANRVPEDQFPIHWDILDIEISKDDDPEIRSYSVAKKTP